MSRKPSVYGRVDATLDDARVPGSFFGRPWGVSSRPPPSRQASHALNRQVAYIGNVHNAYTKDVVRRAAAHLQPRQPPQRQASKPKQRRTMRLDPVTGDWVYA